MANSIVKKNAQVLLALVRQLADTPGLTWIDANNAIYSPCGPFARLFRNKADRVAFGKTQESKQIDDLIDSLPEPPVRPGPPEDWSKFMIPIDKPTTRRPRQRAGSTSR